MALNAWLVDPGGGRIRVTVGAANDHEEDKNPAASTNARIRIRLLKIDLWLIRLVLAKRTRIATLFCSLLLSRSSAGGLTSAACAPNLLQTGSQPAASCGKG